MRNLTKLGYIKDALHKARRFQRHEGATPTVASYSAEQHEGKILDQNECGSCTGHGTSQWMQVTYAVARKPLPYRPSPKGIYAVTRALDRAQDAGPGPLPALTDSGGMPADVIVAVSMFGVRELVMPSPLGFQTDVDTSNVIEEEQLGQLEAAAVEILGAARRIEPTAPGFCRTLAAAIQATGAAGLGIFVDTTFERFAQGAPPVSTVDLNDPQGGGHWIAATSFYTLPNGKLVFRGPNSWTSQWGSAGHWEETEDALVQACSDAYCLYL